MKKITIYLMMLISVSAFSQIEIVDNFNSESSGSAPTNWTGEMQTTASYICDGEGLSAWSFLPAGNTASMVSQNYTGISNGTNLTANFSYNIFERTSQFPGAQNVNPTTDWGSLVFEYSTDGGTTWTNISTIDDSNYTFTDASTCQSASVSVGTIASGSDFQVRFLFNLVNVAGFRTIVVIDNISITQEADAIPNCDAVLLSPLNGADDADTDVSITWQAATGLATGYTVSVGTTSGGTDIVNGVITTETSYDLTGLSYVTPYYVNIVPFNSIGDAIGCNEESFTTRSAPLIGATCSSPIVVSSFPYIESNGDTANYENNIDVSPCNNTYMKGNDVFYEITPTTDMSINIEVNSILPDTGNRAGVHVVQGCPDVATECVDYIGSYSGASRSLLDVVLLSGNTYYVVLSSSNANSTYGYSLIITQNSCINPTLGALTPIADCDNDEFSVDVEISYLGSATSLTLSDDFSGTSDITNISSTGIVTAGPYPSGTIVNFTLTNDGDDGLCSYTNSTFFYCPPSNDDCVNAIDLTATINSDDSCSLFTSATNTGATESIADPSACTSSNTNDVWFSFTASSEIMILEYLNAESAPGFPNGGTFQSTELLSGTCGAFTSLLCSSSAYVTFSGLTINETYYIRSKTNTGSSQQNYDICLREAPVAPANDECLDAVTLLVPTVEGATELVSGTLVGSTLSSDNSCDTSNVGDVWYVLNPTVTGVYEFSIAENPTLQDGSVSYSIYEGTCGALVSKIPSCTNSSEIITLNMGSTYYAMVQSSQSYPGITFDLDITKLPDAVANSDCASSISIIESTDETGNNAISGNINVTSIAYNSPEGCESSSSESVWYSLTPQYTGTYHFDFTRVSGSANYTVYNTGDCSQTTSAGYVPGITSCSNSGLTPKTGDLVAGNTYLILIHSSSAAEYSFFAYADELLNVDANDFETFKYYPNPVKNTLTVEANNAISQIGIYNIVGQKVKEMTPNTLTTSINMNELNKGVYFVTIIMNNSQKTFRVIKE
ncbi:T9SS type A sorting domain-containing protein [Winogradskyella sp. ECml5-4]|uniref:T9SS type A sorting domain-containing protein n=1 Tax=Winogradskyella sp. ECml5-4 TaxID=3110975 RepID=UPI002FF180CB